MSMNTAKCYHTAVQYNKDKSNKCFFLVYALNCGQSSYLHNFYLHRGKDSAVTEFPGISACAVPVAQLTKNSEYHNKNHTIWADNFFQTVALCKFTMESRGIHSGGTLRTNRVPASIIPKDWYLETSSRTQRGNMKCMKIEDDIYVTTWNDMRPVNMISTFPPSAQDNNTRWNKDSNGSSEIVARRPNIVEFCNGAIGGTDSFDPRLAY
jgi:hypothetical protein